MIQAFGEPSAESAAVGCLILSTYMWASTHGHYSGGLLVHNFSIEEPLFQMINMFTMGHVRFIFKNWSYREPYTPLNSINVFYIRNRSRKGYFLSFLLCLFCDFFPFSLETDVLFKKEKDQYRTKNLVLF